MALADDEPVTLPKTLLKWGIIFCVIGYPILFSRLGGLFCNNRSYYMPVIILTEPYMRHYTGSVFAVSDAIGVSAWDDDDRAREKQSCFDQRVYFLPDDGKGMPAELPVLMHLFVQKVF